MINRVGVVLFAERSEGLHAILQRRGEIDFERNWETETWPGGLQVTAHGGLKPQEDEIQALLRECQEELGHECAFHIRQNLDRLHELSTHGAPSRTLGLVVPSTVIQRVRLHPASGGLKVITSKDAKHLQPLRDFPRDRLLPQNVLAMHNDEIDAVVRGFAVFG